MNKIMDTNGLNKKKIEAEKQIKYWLQLFPERKKRDDVEKMVKEISGKRFDCFLESYQKENEVVEQIRELFLDLDRFQCKNKIDEICEQLCSENKWVYFYRPVLYKNADQIVEEIYSSKMITDPDKLLLDVLTDVTDKLSGQSYRVLVNAYNEAAEKGVLFGETTERRNRYFRDYLLKNTKYLEELYMDYPELYVVMNRTTSYTLEYILEIIRNTEREMDKINRELGDGKPFGKLYSIHIGNGDCHNNGKTVAGLVFEDGQKLMYKPRSLKMEESYARLIKWVNQNVSESTGVSYCKVYTCEDAGWTEFIENTTCENAKEVEEFYKKMGEILCIIYTLNAKDFHCENVIANGKFPILIDLETLIHVDDLEKKQEQDAIEEKIYDFINHSVYSTAMLPSVLQNYNTEECMEVGAISSGRKRISPFKAQVLKGTDSDHISIESQYQEVPLNQNLPVYDGKQIGAGGYFSFVKNSFVKMYRWIQEHREEYIHMLKEVFDDVECRVIYKTTNNYTQLLNTSYHPSLLHNEVDREVYFHRIGLLYDEKENLSVLYQDEIAAMMNGDVPVYFMRSNGNYVYNASEKKISKFYLNTPIDKIEEKVRGMSETDMERQIALIYFSFIGCEIPTDISGETELRFAVDGLPKKSCDFIQTAKNIADKAVDRAFTGRIHGKKQISWFGFEGMGEHGYSVVPVGWDLYKGNCGIALYYFYLAEITGEKKYNDYAFDILCSVEKTFQDATAEDLKFVGVGAFTGVTGYIYTLYKMVERNWISKSEIQFRLDIVEQLLDYIESCISENDRVDVLTGTAGILGTFVSVYPYTSGSISEKVFDIIKKAAAHLLEKVILKEDKKATWFENSDIGYVHGNTGIITHLARANCILKDKNIEDIIEKVLRYEREDCYDAQKQRWIMRENAHYFSWCNGIAGMILGKIMLKEAGVQDPLLDQEIAQMTVQLKDTGFGNSNCLCHGDMGTLCVLKYVAGYLHDNELMERCWNTTVEYVGKNMEHGKMFVLEDWGLMTGNAGVGLGLLEQATEESFLASVLSLR